MQPFDTRVVIDLFLKLYTVLVNLSYIPAAALSLPPHTFPEREIQRFAADMDPVALDLVQRLPYLRGLTVIQLLLALGAKISYTNWALHRIRWSDYVEKWSL